MDSSQFLSKEQDEDYNWYKNNYNDLFKKYGNCFLVIKDKEVLGNYVTFAEALKKTKVEYELGSFIIQRCNGTESAYTSYNVTAYSC